MDAVEFLRGYLRAVREWERLCAEAARMRAVGTRINNAFGGIPAGDAARSKVEAALVGVSEVLAAADAAKTNIEARRAEICAVIDRLPDERHRIILRLRYLNGYRWEDVAERAGYTTRQVYNLHRAAVARVRELLEEGPSTFH